MPHEPTTPAEVTPAEVAWHALEVDEAFALLDSGSSGLTPDEVVRRREVHGENRLDAAPPVSALVLLVRQFTSPLILILLVATLVTVLLEEFTDAAVIVAVLVLNAVIGFTQERRADRSVHALMSLASPTATVLRTTGRTRLDAVELVPGDVVLLEAGDRVPADLRLVEVARLRIDESMLTGESEPTTKDTDPVAADRLAADRCSMAHLGTSVTAGRATGVVVATGERTVLGGIAVRMGAQERPETPLQRRMARFANVVAAAVLASTVLAFALGVALGGSPEEMFLTAVALAVAVVPEGLPVAFTVAMALGVRRMARRRVIVRTLPAVETLGSTTVIGSDKTGTLTENRMTVVAAWTPAGTTHEDDQLRTGLGDASADDAALVELLRTGVLANAADLRREPSAPDHGDGSASSGGVGGIGGGTLSTTGTGSASATATTTELIVPVGDPTETALLSVALAAGIDPAALRREVVQLLDVPFAAEQRYSFVITDEDGPLLRLKGAPERVLDRCVRMLRADGTEVPLEREQVDAAVARLAERGLRVLATAQRRLEGPASRWASARRGGGHDAGSGLGNGELDGYPHGRSAAEDAPDPDELVLTGLVGLQDPPRQGVRDAIASCRRAGLRVIMITGDHPATARSIARDLGIDGTDAATVVTGDEVELADDARLSELVRTTRVFARVAPEHKLRIVLALQAHGEVVAVTGDGVNDAPALKAGDIGIAMGRDGTDVAREASDMVLTDDDFVAIVAAVEEGRVVFDNVRKVTYFLLSTGMASIVAILAAIATGLPLPYTPAALLWLNVVTNGLQDVALAFEPGEPDVLERPPRDPREGIVSRALWERTALTGTTLAAGSLWLYVWAIGEGLSEDAQRGVALTTFVVAMALHAYNARSERRSILASDPRTNPLLLAAVLGSLVVHVAALHWAPTQALLRIAPFAPEAWLRMLAVALAVVLVSEAHKHLRRGSAT
jgi:magnesium-transporting ATPase (P-type)